MTCCCFVTEAKTRLLMTQRPSLATALMRSSENRLAERRKPQRRLREGDCLSSDLIYVSSSGVRSPAHPGVRRFLLCNSGKQELVAYRCSSDIPLSFATVEGKIGVCPISIGRSSTNRGEAVIPPRWSWGEMVLKSRGLLNSAGFDPAQSLQVGEVDHEGVVAATIRFVGHIGKVLFRQLLDLLGADGPLLISCLPLCLSGSSI